MASTEPSESACPRPAPGELSAAWHNLFSDPLLSLGNLKAEATGAGIGPAGEDGGVLLRSVYWRFYMDLLPPPTSLDLFPAALAARRKAYDELRARFLVAPDGRWAADCSGGEGYAPSSPKVNSSGGWDPLSLDGESPWKTWFAHLDLRAMIRQDVDRTFPDIPYFTIERVRRSMTTMLFLFAVLNPDVGYRQGMHELLAVCLHVVDRDSLRPDASLAGSASFAGMAEAMAATLDRNYVEHDAFGLFQQLMRPAKQFYEWRAEEGPPTRGVTGPQAPVIVRANHMNSHLLRRIDPQLWERMETEGVEPQIWAIRWLRLLFTRELSFSLALRLWDGMFAEDPQLSLIDYICIAMLQLIRNDLIDADYPAMLTLLLHYPAPSDTYPFNPCLILSQAKLLRDNVSPAAGVEVVLQNQELLGVRASGPERDSDPASPSNSVFFGRGTPSPRPGSAVRGKQKAGMQGLAQGLFERAQKAGLDKAILSTVTDLRNSLPDSTTFFPSFSPSHTPGARENSPFSTIPSSTAILPARPQPKAQMSSDSDSTKSQLDAERQMAEVRLAMLGMGKAMTEWLDVLRESSGSKDSERTTAAWKGLEKVRDGLLDAAGRDVDDLVKDWAWNDDLHTSQSRGGSTAATPISEPITMPSPPRTPTGSSSQATQVTPKALGRRDQSSPSDALSNGSPGEPSKPHLHLSRRDDKPSPTLPRVPLHHPRPSTRATGASGSSAAKRLSASVSLPAPIQPRSPPTSPPQGPVDPLAGFGVGSMHDEQRRTLRPASALAAAPVSDPLGVN